MNNVVELQVSGEKVVLKVPRADIIQEFDNIASFDSKTKNVISVGINQEEFQKNYPRKWNKYKGKLEFAPIFGVQSFNLEAAGMFIGGWLRTLASKIARGMIFRSQLKLELIISFDGYENIPLDKQREFEFLIFRYFFARKLIINGKAKIWERKNRIPLWLFLGLNFAFVMASIIPWIFSMSYWIGIISVTEAYPILNLLLFVGGLVGLFALFGYLGSLLSILLWALCLKPFVSSDILFWTLKYQPNAPIKSNMNRLSKYLINLILNLVLASNK